MYNSSVPRVFYFSHSIKMSNSIWRYGRCMTIPVLFHGEWTDKGFIQTTNDLVANLWGSVGGLIQLMNSKLTKN